MLFCTLQFLVVLAVAPKYGLLARWLRLRNLVPQQVIEDILTTILRYGKTTPLAIVQQYVESGKDINKALQRMTQDQLIISSANGFDLTEDGAKEADKVLRAHRLWEAYLETIGTPEDQIHPTAHKLEHISDDKTVDYLDEKLGKQSPDPHGQSIS
jgi:manganese/iron transport system permease protein/iron/zinc/copper transport system permease protein